MHSSVNNLKAMKVNFRNRKLHLNFPKDQILKTDHKESIPSLDNNDKLGKGASLTNSGVRLSSGYHQHDRI